MASETTRFNYFYSFDYLPKRIKKFNKQEIIFDDVISYSDLPSEYGKFSNKIEINSSGLNNDRDVLLYLIQIPSQKSISEVCRLLIVRSKKGNFARLYSLEYSIDNYCVCDLTDERHDNLGLISGGEDFLSVCLKHFRLYGNDCLAIAKGSNLDKLEDEIAVDKQVHQENIVIQSASPTTDIYGTPISNRLKDVFNCIQEGADWMIKQLVQMPIVSVQGRMETEIIIASILALEIDKGLVIQSLLLGNPLYNNIGITRILAKIENYISLYKQNVNREYVKKSSPLLEFAKDKGKLKIADFKIPDAYGHPKLGDAMIQNIVYQPVIKATFFERRSQEGKSRIFSQKRLIKKAKNSRFELLF